MIVRTALLSLALVAAPAFAEEPAYRDDRSDAAALIGSLYNAIDRQEYARAWGYFDDPKPAASFEAFAQGYAGTAGVELRTGASVSDGAAGSVYFEVPVAIRATDAQGGTRVFAGCYVVRQVDPAIQEPPFRPLLIVSGKLAPTEADLDAALPAACPQDG